VDALTEPQVWVVIGVFATSFFAMMSWQTISFNRNLRTSFDALDRSLTARIDGLREATNARFDALDVRVTTLEKKLDGLDRDVQALTRHVFGTDRG
jgi:hypothetical protein